MKLRAISIAITKFASTTASGRAVWTLQPVTVSVAPIAQCVPTNWYTGHACDGFNPLVRANFSAREIRRLFGARTSCPESLTGSIERLQKRYHTMLRKYVAAQHAAGEHIAAK